MNFSKFRTNAYFVFALYFSPVQLKNQKHTEIILPCRAVVALISCTTLEQVQPSTLGWSFFAIEPRKVKNNQTHR